MCQILQQLVQGIVVVLVHHGSLIPDDEVSAACEVGQGGVIGDDAHAEARAVGTTDR